VGYDPSPRRGPVYVVRSSDGGEHWTEPVTIDTRSAPLPDGCNPHGKVAQLPDGTLLMSLYFCYREGQPEASYQLDFGQRIQIM